MSERILTQLAVAPDKSDEALGAVALELTEKNSALLPAS